MKPSTANTIAAGYAMRSRRSTATTSMGASASTTISRASTTFSRSPARMAATASATAPHHASGDRWAVTV